MSKAIDPILLLKEHIKSAKKIEKQGQNLIFSDGLKLKLDTPTAFIQSHTDKKQYTLGSLWFYLKHRNDSLSVYKTELQKEKIDTVVGIDKDPIIDFFINDNNDVKIIDEDLREKTLIFLGKKKPQSESLEKLMEEEKTNKTNEGNITTNNFDLNSKQIQTLKKPRLEDLDPNIRIMDYIYTKQKHSLNRNSILRPMNNLISFENLLSVCKRTFTANKKHEHKQSDTISFLDELLASDDLRGNKGIIIVPTTYTPGSLCIDNAKQFLVDAVYVNPADTFTNLESKTHLENSKNKFSKKILGKELNFEIHSNVRNFSRNDWKRVVAVFVQGSDWEFNDWPKGETTNSILLKIKGFHLKYSDMSTNENVKKWNVKILEISRFKRHFDVSVQNELWNILEQFLSQPRYREKAVNK